MTKGKIIVELTENGKVTCVRTPDELKGYEAEVHDYDISDMPEDQVKEDEDSHQYVVRKTVTQCAEPSDLLARPMKYSPWPRPDKKAKVNEDGTWNLPMENVDIAKLRESYLTLLHLQSNTPSGPAWDALKDVTAFLLHVLSLTFDEQSIGRMHRERKPVKIEITEHPSISREWPNVQNIPAKCYICLHCKRYWLDKGARCSCGTTTKSETDQSNYKHAEDWMSQARDRMHREQRPEPPSS